MIKRLVLVGVAVMTTVLALVVAWQFRIVVINVLISLVLAATVRPLINRLVGRALKIRVAWILIYLAAFGSLGYLLFLTNGAAVHEIQKLAQTVAVQDIWRLPVWLQNVTFLQFLVTRLPAPSSLFEAVTGEEGQFVLPALLNITQGVGDVVSNAIVILILSIYWSINQRHFELLWLSLLPSSQRKQARSIWRMTESTIGAYIRGQGMQSLLGGLLLGVGYWLIGSPYPALLGLISALAFLVPVAGVAVIVLAPLVVGLLTGIQLGIMTALYALVVLIAVGIWVKPRFFEQRWNDPILTLVLLIALASVFGLPGLIIAPPLSIVCLILWNRLVSHRRSLEAASQISDLRERQERLRITIQAMDEPPPPLVSSSMERLLQLIEKAEPILQAVYPGNVSDGSVSDRTEEKGKNIGKSAS
jgi:predicted PurR-regulated permease PerM